MVSHTEPFIQLRVADEGYVLVGRLRPAPLVLQEILLRQGGEIRGYGPETHGARGEVDRVGVLRTAGIRLQAMERPQGLQVFLLQVAQEELDGCGKPGTRGGLMAIRSPGCI